MCQISRALIFVLIVTDFSVTLLPPCLGPSEGHKHGVSIQSPIIWVTHFWKNEKQQRPDCLVRLFIYLSSIVSQILDRFIQWLFTIFGFDHMTGENRELYFAKRNEICTLKNEDSYIAKWKSTQVCHGTDVDWRGTILVEFLRFYRNCLQLTLIRALFGQIIDVFSWIKIFRRDFRRRP